MLSNLKDVDTLQNNFPNEDIFSEKSLFLPQANPLRGGEQKLPWSDKRTQKTVWYESLCISN